jgi:hypothetical protein
MNIFEKYKPSVSKHNLLLIAGIVWTTAGGILGGRGIAYLLEHGDHPGLRMAGGILFGVIFYVLLFAEISGKHIRRIRGLKIPYPCAFSFFNVRGYLMMALMITGGISLRRLDVISRVWLYNFYVTMAVPLLISAGRFYYFRATNKELP